MNTANFWCEKCGESLAVCDGSQWCSAGRKRGIDLYFIMMNIEHDAIIRQMACDMAIAYGGNIDVYDAIVYNQFLMKGEMK